MKTQRNTTEQNLKQHNKTKFTIKLDQITQHNIT